MTDATRTLAASRVASLVGDFDRSPAYAGLADELRLLIGDGRIELGVRLPSERELTEAIGVSRTTVSRAYASLSESGYAEARRGAGTFTRVPGGRGRVHDRALSPGPPDPDVLDLSCAAASAPPGVAAAYVEAAAELPAYLGGHGYYPRGLPQLQARIARSYAERGLPTDPDQIMVTPGALSAAAVVARAFSGPRDRVLVEQPVYPNAVQALRNSGARLSGMPVDPDGWDLAAVGTALREVRPRLAYLIPDFQNPTGHVMTSAQREEYAGHLAASGTTAVVDEAHQALALDGQAMPPPFACFAPDTLTLGSASKSYWGGLRLGWIRCPAALIDVLTDARLGLDLGAPVMEQLVLTRLLSDTHAAVGRVVEHHRERLREQRDALLAALTSRLPDWRFHRPAGGLAVWCQLPSSSGTAVSVEAERLGVVLTPGPMFAVQGGLDRFVRIPWTRPAPELEDAVDRIAEAWSRTAGRTPRTTPGPTRVMVA